MSNVQSVVRDKFVQRGGNAKAITLKTNIMETWRRNLEYMIQHALCCYAGFSRMGFLSVEL